MLKSTAEPRPTFENLGAFFAALLFATFLMGVFLFKPQETEHHQIIRIIGSLLCGLFGYFVSGRILVNVTGQLSSFGTFTVKATSGAAFFAIVFITWPTRPVTTPKDFQAISTGPIAAGGNVSITQIQGITPVEAAKILKEGMGGVDESLQKLTGELKRSDGTQAELLNTFLDLARRIEIIGRPTNYSVLSPTECKRFEAAQRVLKENETRLLRSIPRASNRAIIGLDQGAIVTATFTVRPNSAVFGSIKKFICFVQLEKDYHPKNPGRKMPGGYNEDRSTTINPKEFGPGRFILSGSATVTDERKIEIDHDVPFTPILFIIP